MTHHPIPEIGILNVQQFVECHPLRFIGVSVALVKPATEQTIELARTPTGTPAQAFEAGFFHQGYRGWHRHRVGPKHCGSRFGGSHTEQSPCPKAKEDVQIYAERRCTISFLISAIALAGLRPLGQVRAQFMIVWQR